MSIWASLLLAIGGPSGSLCSYALRVPAVAKSSFVADASRRHMICSAMVNKVNHITEILEPTNERLMEILTKAMAEIEARKFRGENVFLDVEDLHLYLDRDDREAFDKAQKKHKMAAKELHDFERRYREKRNELMPVEPVKVKKGTPRSQSSRTLCYIGGCLYGADGSCVTCARPTCASHMIMCFDRTVQRFWTLCMPCFEDEYGPDVWT